VPYSGFTLDEVPVQVGASTTHGTISVSHSETGRLSIRVQRPWSIDRLAGWWEGKGSTITSTSAQPPFVSIENAKLTEDADTEHYWASQALITHVAEPIDTKIGVNATYYLTGLHFPDGKMIFDAGGLRWTLELLDGFGAAGDKLAKQGSGTITALLKPEIVAFSRAGELDDIASEIARLLSFGCGVPVRFLRVDYATKGSPIRSRLLDGSDENRSFWRAPVISSISKPGLIKLFIESSYQPARAASVAFPLARLISTAIDVRGERVVHTQGLLVANFLEIIRYNHALNVMVPNGKAVLRNEHFQRPGTTKDWKFAEILQDFLKDRGLAGWDKRFLNSAIPSFMAKKLKAPRYTSNLRRF
jgi:hypothetical protein